MFGQKTHQNEAGRDPCPEREDYVEPGVHGPRLPLHCLHDLRLPHPGQVMLHTRPHEWWRPSLPSFTGITHIITK